jgi:DNA polymerase zeta
MFVTKEVREGVLPRLLREILETRIVVKAAMKLAKNDKVRRDEVVICTRPCTISRETSFFILLHSFLLSFFQALYKKLNAQQFGLKMIANVTYGYTSANFSGRMPCVEVPPFILYFSFIPNYYYYFLGAPDCACACGIRSRIP